MRTRIAALLITAIAAPAFGLVIYQGIAPDQIPFDQPDPPGLRELSNFKGRVNAEHMDAPTWGDGYESFNIHFAGDAYILNRFIERYAALRKGDFYRDTPLTIILQDADVPLGKRWDGEPVRPYDWALKITRSRLTRGEPPMLPSTSTVTHVFLTVRISPRVLLSELKIPRELRVESRTSFDRFASEHEERRLGSRLEVLREQAADLQKEISRLTAASRPAATHPSFGQ